jgi:hypothetical protein
MVWTPGKELRMAAFVLLILLGLAFYLFNPTTSSFMTLEFQSFYVFAHFLR